MPNVPIKYSYEVEKDRIYAGQYPRTPEESESAAKMRLLLDFGITAFIDLTEEKEVRPYTKFLNEDCTYSHFPTVDVRTPKTLEKLHEIIESIDAAVRAGRKVYVHCRGGIDRTGVIVACWFVYNGLSPEDAFNEYEKRWQTNPRSKELGFQPLIYRRRDYLVQYAQWLERRPRFPLVPKDRTLRDRYQGCLLGGAVGDALGAPVEFMSRDEIVRKFGEPGIRDYVKCYGKIGAITDDTQMTLFTAEGLLRGYVRGSIRGIGHLPSMIASAYLRWLQTQGYRAEPLQDGWLASHRELFARRAPGNTCLSALEAMRSLGDPMVAENNSKGCGGVMRVAPVALFCKTWHGSACQDDIDKIATETSPNQASAFVLGDEAAGITHGHPTGHLSAGVFASVVYLLLCGLSLRDCFVRTFDALRHHAHHEETLAAVENALELSRSRPNDPQTMKGLGEGWVAEEALAIGLYAALSAVESTGTPSERFESGLVLSVNHDGDSDSTGSICGNLLGAIFGKSAIPQRWLEPLELREVIERIADDLATFEDWEIDEYSLTETAKYYMERYPGY